MYKETDKMLKFKNNDSKTSEVHNLYLKTK
jgi:hypothetical protein